MASVMADFMAVAIGTENPGRQFYTDHSLLPIDFASVSGRNNRAPQSSPADSGATDCAQRVWRSWLRIGSDDLSCFGIHYFGEEAAKFGLALRLRVYPGGPGFGAKRCTKSN
jgi:hypothetical protein